MKRSTLLSLSAAAALLVPASARADLILIGPVSGTGGGLGSQFTVLTLQAPGGTNMESGCVTPSGVGTVATCGFANMGVMTGASQTQVQLLSQPGLAGLTGETLRLIYNGAEPGVDPSNTITGLNLTLYSGSTAIFTAAFTGAPRVFETFAGVGSLGYMFGLDAAQAAMFNSARAGATGTLSIGVGASVANAEGGLETFAIAVGPAMAVVPEPATVVLLGSGLLGLGLFGARSRRRNGTS